MKSIEDAPKELQNLFKIELEKWIMPPDRDTEHAFRLAVQHFFFLGFDVAMATGGLKPKRTIAEVHQIDDSFFVVSNDRKMFHWQGNRIGWYALPNLPQD